MDSSLGSIAENEPLSTSHKRSADDKTDSMAKKFKKSTLDPDLLKAIQNAQTNIDNVWPYISNRLLPEPVDQVTWESIIKEWKVTLQAAENKQAFDFTALAQRLPDFEQGTLKDAQVARIQRLAQKAHSALENFSALYTAQQNARPSPSLYAQKWAEPQERFDDLLCMRPTKRTGLPLISFHDIFRQFCRQIDQPLPKSADTAHRVASLLCSKMGDSFKTEGARSESFNRCIQELFSGWSRETIVNPTCEATYGRIDFTLETHRKEDSLYKLIIREDKVEHGEAGDAYVQAARDYQLWVHTLKDRHSTQADNLLIIGVPIFILCIIGPTLYIAGGFYDGSACIIEPLGPPHWMLEDVTGRRQSTLARVLNALDVGVQKLQVIHRGLMTSPKTYAPGVPRVYDSFRSLVDDTSTLRLTEPLSTSSHHPCFTGQLTDGEEKAQRVLVKMVRGAYGQDVHESLAGLGYAPTLYGMCEKEGLPTLHVMEYLDGWTTLFEFGRRTVCDVHLVDIRRALDTILDHLEGCNFVHGDMRTNNIMIQVKNGKPVYSTHLNLKIVDFDWAGRAGEVHYPAERNTEIGWPGWAGEAIELGHDRKLVNSWWTSFGKPEVPT